MEYVGILAPALRGLKVMLHIIEKHKGIRQEQRLAVRSLLNQMRMIGASTNRYEVEDLQELAYDVEDFLPRVFEPGAVDFILTPFGLNRGAEQVAAIKHFMERFDDIKKQPETGEAGGSLSVASGALAENSDAHELQGEAKREFLKLLSEADDRRMRVISIVGCNGSGKTALARAVYQDSDFAKTNEFNCKAWVVAPSKCNDAGNALREKNAEDCLKNILKQVRQTPSATRDDIDSSDLSQLKEELHVLLTKRRYLVVVDDLLKAQLWDDVKSAFPDTDRSRIIVTTSIQPIATYLSRSSDRYVMPYLDISSSRKLLRKEMDNNPPSTDEERILSKCDGLPLAVVSVAKHLRLDRTEDNCRQVGQALGSLIEEGQEAFGELKRMLTQCYGSLPGYRDRRCLLSVSMFPQGYRINRNSLLRKWIAEGLIASEGQRSNVVLASQSFKQYVNRSIIDPVKLFGNTSEVKRYQVQGLMLEFIVHKSTCVTNFLTIIGKDGRLPKQSSFSHVRRLSFHGDTKESPSCANEIDVSVIRWLSICSCSCIPIDLSKCSLLRVLDLEDCKKLDDVVLASICMLVSLKYLSLRGSDVKEIPMKITKLVNLETLDIRKTEVKELPMEVIVMPGLVHLFGRFKILPHGSKSIYGKLFHNPKEISSKMKKLLSRQIKLQTLAGVVIDDKDQCFKQIMLHATKLKKVKIWCTTPRKDLFPMGTFYGSQFLESLSIDSCDQPMGLHSHGLPDSLPCSNAISSIKLRGALERLPDFFFLKSSHGKQSSQLNGCLTKLQLSSTGLSSEALSALQNISCLVYLKLAEKSSKFGNGYFLVESEGFPSLLRLCIEAPRLPKMQLKKGAMRRLTSLGLLLCPKVPVQTAATAGTTSCQSGTPQTGRNFIETGVTSEISYEELKVSPLRTIAAWSVFILIILMLWIKIKLFHYLGKMIGANSEITAPLETGVSAGIEGRIGVEGLSNLGKLDEVILHHSTTDGVMEDWKEAAKKHVNRPSVKKQPEPTRSNIP